MIGVHETGGTPKGNQWYSAMKVRAGFNKTSNLIYLAAVTPSNLHDLIPAAALLHGEDEVVCTDADY